MIEENGVEEVSVNREVPINLLELLASPYGMRNNLGHGNSGRLRPAINGKVSALDRRVSLHVVLGPVLDRLGLRTRCRKGDHRAVLWQKDLSDHMIQRKIQDIEAPGFRVMDPCARIGYSVFAIGAPVRLELWRFSATVRRDE